MEVANEQCNRFTNKMKKKTKKKQGSPNMGKHELWFWVNLEQLGRKAPKDIFNLKTNMRMLVRFVMLKKKIGEKKRL